MEIDQLFAFWRYDLFPYVLGGRITKMREGGAVETEEYGRVRTFVPFKILNLEEGKRVLAELENLRNQHDRAMEKLKAEFLVRREAILQVPPKK